MRGPILVSLKTLCQLYPMYTKAGKVWKNRTDWSKIEIPGMLIVTQFGIVTFVKAERINKEWYWTLLSMNGFYYTIKRDQARWNKRIPKKPLRKYAYQAAAKPVSVLEKLLVEANKQAHIKKARTWESIQEELQEDIADGWVQTELETFTDKVRFIFKHTKVKTSYRLLANEYHPDKSTYDNEYFRKLNVLYNLYNK